MEDGMFEFAHIRMPGRTAFAWRTLAGAAIVAALAGCGDDESNLIFVPGQPTGTVFTLHDATFDFTTLRTFVMPDTVVQLAPVSGTSLPVTHSFDAAILAQVRANLLSRGYVEITTPGTEADFVVLVGVTAAAHYNAWVGYNVGTVWGFFPNWDIPGFDSSWGIVYPWFPQVGATSFNSGTLIVDMVPTRLAVPAARTVQSVWAGVASTLLTGTVSTSQVTGAVDQMFAQSPYLVAGP
jgi:hypothetical protein